MRAHRVVNVSNIKPFEYSEDFQPGPLYEDDSGEFYAPQAIVDHARDPDNSKQFLFRVRWLGYSAEHDTWEPEANLTTCKQLIEDYFARMGRK